MKIIYYYHIPKSGGTTIFNELRLLAKALNGEFHNFNTSMNNRFGFPKKSINDYKLSRFLDNINNETNDFKFIHHHHHGYYGISEIYDILSQQKETAESNGNEFFLFTCIRDPLSFQISRTNYLRNSCGMPNLSFDDACNDVNHQNVMYKYLLYNHPQRWKKMNLEKEFFMKNLGIMDKIFLLEEFDNLKIWLEQITGTCNKSLEKKANVGTHLLLPNDEQREGIKRVNTLDQFFYDFVKEEYCN